MGAEFVSADAGFVRTSDAFVPRESMACEDRSTPDLSGGPVNPDDLCGKEIRVKGCFYRNSMQ